MNISKFLFQTTITPPGDFLVGLTFSKFSKVLPVKRVYETKRVMAFWGRKRGGFTEIGA